MAIGLATELKTSAAGVSGALCLRKSVYSLGASRKQLADAGLHARGSGSNDLVPKKKYLAEDFL
jgi:hypothetical protein